MERPGPESMMQWQRSLTNRSDRESLSDDRPNGPAAFRDAYANHADAMIGVTGNEGFDTDWPSPVQTRAEIPPDQQTTAHEEAIQATERGEK